jgi:hypothetical protein
LPKDETLTLPDVTGIVLPHDGDVEPALAIAKAQRDVAVSVAVADDARGRMESVALAEDPAGPVTVAANTAGERLASCRWSVEDAT